jgi:hypothetical protein
MMPGIGVISARTGRKTMRSSTGLRVSNELSSRPILFAAAIAMRGLSVPSVVQLRTGSTDPNDVGSFVLDCIAAAESELFGGAILTIGAGRARLRRGPSNSQAADET